MTYAKIIADSTYKDGVRLTTMEVRFHRFVLAEFNTHRVFSRNSASSRAIPFDKQVAKIQEALAYPMVWPAEQKGMQGGEPLSREAQDEAWVIWGMAADDILTRAGDLRILGLNSDERLHKSVVNRLLEPFMWHTAIVTSTAWENFFAQRDHEAAQPEIAKVAEMMHEAYRSSTPIPLAPGMWHLPYIDNEDREWAAYQDPARLLGASAETNLAKISAARCARVSYLTQSGVRDHQEDLDLYSGTEDKKGLLNGDVIHWSPLEHVATPWPQNRQDAYRHGLTFDDENGINRHVETNHLPRVGNLLAWRSLRTTVETQRGERTFR